jgi:hypothetical protein
MMGVHNLHGQEFVLFAHSCEQKGRCKRQQKNNKINFYYRREKRKKKYFSNLTLHTTLNIVNRQCKLSDIARVIKIGTSANKKLSKTGGNGERTYFSFVLFDGKK